MIQTNTSELENNYVEHSHNLKIIESTQHATESTTDLSTCRILKAIHSDQLSLKRVRYQNDLIDDKFISYIDIHWSELSKKNHHGIINLAKQSGSLVDLFYWYISAVAESIQSDTKEHKEDKVAVIDVYSASLLENKSIRFFLSTLIKLNNKLVFRLPFDVFRQDHLQDFLTEIYLHNSRLMLNLDKRVIDVGQLKSTPIAYIEMSSNKNIIKNSLLTEKRNKMIEQAQLNNIETVLTGSKSSAHYDYAQTLGFDYY